MNYYRIKPLLIGKADSSENNDLFFTSYKYLIAGNVFPCVRIVYIIIDFIIGFPE